MVPLILRVLRNLPLIVISPFLVLFPALAIAVADLVQPRRKSLPSPNPRQTPVSASVVIPNWNGRDLLEKYIPSIVTALAGNPANEIVVVDNASHDGSADFLREKFPQVRVLPQATNLGFGGGSNAGIRAAKNDIVVLLNSDMRVAPDFLQPLLDGFTSDLVFAVSCQIYFSDPSKLREETGLTEAKWANGGLRVRHRDDLRVKDLYPCFYGGGGSCAFDRAKFLELGGFDELLRPFYLEDTDLGYMAWKRGWQVLYQPRSVVFHEHRGTIGKHFSREYINGILKKNFALWTWKNIHDWRRLVEHFTRSFADAMLSVLAGDSPERTNLAGLFRANLQIGAAIRARRHAQSLAAVDDTEAFRRTNGAYYLDRFSARETPDRLRVLFLSPYPICPPIHGGGVFMYQTLRELTKHCDVHLIVLVDKQHEIPPHAELAARCQTTEFITRPQSMPKAIGSITPSAVREFALDDVAWSIGYTMYHHRVDVLQIEYTNMGQYALALRQSPSIVFEHDISFQSVGRLLANTAGVFKRLRYGFEYLRALRWELRMLPKADRVQVCTPANRDYLLGFLPQLSPKIDTGLRAGIDTANYAYSTVQREPDTILFLGSFRHLPNIEALDWFVKLVLPHILRTRPWVRLLIAGAEPPPRHSLPNVSNIELLGFIPDIHEPLRKYSVFICPILSGSGVRVKLLEAFAAGIPVVATTVGAEGLATTDGEFCAIADDPAQFAAKTIHLLDHPDEAAAMASRARAEVAENWDMARITSKLEQSYRAEVSRRRP